MKFVEFNELGNPADVLEVKEAVSRSPGVGEVRVKVLATPIHPANLLQIAGQYGTETELPGTPGAEGVGEVVEVGEGVEHVVVGQKVLLTGVGGTWRDELTAQAALFTPAPPGDVEQLAMLAVNPMTAHLLLSESTDLKEGDWIVQSAANSAVGEMVIQLAAARGIRTVNVVRRESLLMDLRSLGGTVVLVDGPELAVRVKDATEGASIKLALDCVGGETFERLVAISGEGATVVSYGNLSGEQPRLDLRSLTGNDIRVRGFWLAKWYERASPEDKQKAFGELVPRISSGQAKMRVDSRFALDEIGAAVTRAAAGGRDGKVLLVPNAETSEGA